MPDIAMCGDDKCPSRGKCYRHKDGGTKPSEWRQAYMDFQRPADAVKCCDFLPARKKDKTDDQ